MKLQETLSLLDARVAAGDILGAYDTFFAENCSTFSNDADRTYSKGQKREYLVGFLNNIARVNNIELVGKPSVQGDVSESHFIFDFTNRRGEKMVWNEIIRRTWKNGLVVTEQYLAYQPEAKKPVAKTEKPVAKIAKTDAPTASKTPRSAKNSIADDLTLIEGIGPKIAELLKNDGIVTFADLAVAKIDRLQAILTAAGSRYKMHNPGTWPKQSALARDGKKAELKKLQDELKGGKIA
jgi:predicted flap endonuclease-1-like 5' DNA nuclease